MISYFASEGPHIAVAPEALFTVGGVTVTNSMVYGWVIGIFMILFLISMTKRIKISGTRGFARAIEALAEFIYKFTADSLKSQERARKYAPYFATIFFFVLISNWTGLLPIVGKGINYDGTALFRPFTGDLNGTLGMALFAMTLVQIIAIKESGAHGYFRHFFAGKLYNPLTYVIGVSEIFTEFTRLFSLGLRLFLNVVIGEILIAIFAHLGGLFGFATAVPFTLLEVFVGLLQAYIFVLLTVSYLSMAISHHDHEEVEARS